MWFKRLDPQSQKSQKRRERMKPGQIIRQKQQEWKEDEGIIWFRDKFKFKSRTPAKRAKRKSQAERKINKE